MNEQRQQAYLNFIQSLLSFRRSKNKIQEILAANQELLDADFLRVLEVVAEVKSESGQENTANWLRRLATYLNTPATLLPMNEQRKQAYHNLIQSLLNCRNNDEVREILAANKGLFDTDFLQMVEAVAQKFSQNGDENTANWLQNLAMNEYRHQAYFNLIESLFNCSNDDEILETLIANQELIDAGFLQAVEIMVQILSQNGHENRASWLQNLAASQYRHKAYSKLIQSLLNCGNNDEFLETLVENQELIDAGLLRTVEMAAQAFSQNGEEEIANWLQNLTMHLKYSQFLSEVLQAIADNRGLQMIYPLLEKNIDKLNEVLAKILLFLGTNILEKMELDIAKSQASCIVEYSNIMQEFPLGDKASNIEIAIAGYEVALQIYTREASPEGWAIAQNNLGTAYSDRIKEDRAENIEKAIAAYTAALTVRTKEALPEDWAATQHNLANAYYKRIQGDRAENIEKAIAAATAALTVRTKEALPEDWAMTQNSLANAYCERIKGDRADNIEKALAAYAAILSVRTREALPEDWAMTQNNLATAYSERIKGDKAENIEEAIAAATAALTVFTRKASPRSWASTQNNLAIAYSDRIKGDKAENIEEAIAAYDAALTVITREALPLNWAMTQHNIGRAYSNRIKGDRAENIEEAIAAYDAALTIYTKDALPLDWAITQSHIVGLYLDATQFELAFNICESVIATIEFLREEVVSGEESKRKQAEFFGRIYRYMIEVCLKLGRKIEAIEYVERSKTRYLVEQILERDSKDIFPPEVVTQLETYRDEIAAGQYQIQNGTVENPKALTQHLQKLRQQRNELQNRCLPIGYNFNFNLFHATLNECATIIEWYMLDDNILAFIISKKEEIQVFYYHLKERKSLRYLVNLYLYNYYHKNEKWQKNLEEVLKKLTSVLHIDEILKQVPKYCNQLILIPHLGIHVLPLHALPLNQNSENSLCLLDLFYGGISYAPSCQILQQMQQRKRPDFQSLFAVQNPTGDLNYTDLEVQVIQSYFDTTNVLKKTDATLTAINQSELNTYHCAHFSCHGYFNLTNASQSGLVLANAAVEDTATKSNSERYLNVRAGETHDLEKCLTLDKIFALQLEKCRLVTLSACETGLIDFNNTSDEYIGLPSGFLLAGSPSVVSSLWTVDDLSTSFLMIKFYENLFKPDNLEAGDVAIALKEAQIWLRNLTIEELFKFWEDKKVLAQLRTGQVLMFEESLKRIKQRQPLPFANPYYWAGFTASGL